jgi:ketosteroid isomerase-like protein
MSVERNIETIWRFYASGPADDDANRIPFFAPDVVWHVPGANPVSGPYQGPEAIRNEMAARMAPLDVWTIEPVAVMGNADLVMGYVRLRGRRRGHEIDTAGGHVFRFDSEGRVVEAWGFVSKQAELDQFFRA